MAARKSSDDKKVQVMHPVYLDTPMLVSFLATLDDGVFFESEIAERVGATGKSGSQVDGSAKLPSLATLLGLSLSASGRYSRDRTQEQSTESKFVRQHTSASLFNRLRVRLHEDGLLQTVDGATSLENVAPGSIVEISGNISESPVKGLIELMNSIWPFMEEDNSGSGKMRTSPNRSERRQLTSEQQAQLEAARLVQQAAELKREEMQQTRRLVDLVERDLAQSPVVDLLLVGDGVSALVTASREYLSDEVTASLVGGMFFLLGKVTSIDTAEDAETIVIRRGAMGAIAEATILPMLENMGEVARGAGLTVDFPSGKIIGPYMQIIPLAIFV